MGGMDGQTLPSVTLPSEKPGRTGAWRPVRDSGRGRLARFVATFVPRFVAVALAVAVLALAGPVAGSLAAQPRSYRVDVDGSKVHVLVRKAGLLALLAHDHVMVADGFAGRVTVDPQNLGASALQVTVPVASLRVDPEDARQEHSLEGDIDDEDRAEILEAMLSGEQFDAAHFPRVVATLEATGGRLPDVTLSLRVRIKQTEKVIHIPVRVELKGDVLEASGSFELLQSDFGIEPYSTLLGTIAVKDRVVVRFRILARADAG
jgi:polyisoprenoid-binding protein YceI